MTFTEFKNRFQKVEPNIKEGLTSKKPIVTVCVQTYNHEAYIKECLDSILNQKTNFEYEILLGEDFSSDTTRAICLSYAERYNKKIKLFLHYRENNIKINSFPTGRFNFLYNLYLAKGKYIALCEGDDYWTDPLKLQKQVDFLEANDKFVIASHNSNIVNADGDFKGVFNQSEVPQITDTNYILSNAWYIPTASMVFRKDKLIIPKWLHKVLNGDYSLQLILTSDGGLVHYNNEIMSSYRLHEKGVSNVFKNKNVFNNSMLFINKNFNRYSKGKYTQVINENIILHSYKVLDSLPIFSTEFWLVTFNLIWFYKKNSKEFLKYFKRRLNTTRSLYKKKLQNKKYY